ncbi:hypothetical protein CDAR_528481 [Caerostris darwini]|uniref:Uncharacterized protein n=1 Tax=Caerostris darwini TaxID=1538125 RepID=A0AAV4P352_9ARAC|nr:hypothetical protein CDAR_528481 [Caerostris darwini]
MLIRTIQAVARDNSDIFSTKKSAKAVVYDTRAKKRKKISSEYSTSNTFQIGNRTETKEASFSIGIHNATLQKPIRLKNNNNKASKVRKCTRLQKCELVNAGNISNITVKADNNVAVSNSTHASGSFMKRIKKRKRVSSNKPSFNRTIYQKQFSVLTIKKPKKTGLKKQICKLAKNTETETMELGNQASRKSIEIPTTPIFDKRTGILDVTIKSTTFRLRKFDSFIVPSDTAYSIKNTMRSESLLSFSEIDAPIFMFQHTEDTERHYRLFV